MSAEEPGLLGSLPRSRPGTRSEKRETGRSQPKARATTGGKGAPRRGAATPKPAPVERSPDPVGQALKGVAKAAGAGLRVANGVTRGVLRRLPRP